MRLTWQEVEKARAELGLSQRKLAALIDVTQGHLSKLLRGKAPDRHNILARAMAAIAASTGPSEIGALLENARVLAERSAEFRQLLLLMVRMASKKE